MIDDILDRLGKTVKMLDYLDTVVTEDATKRSVSSSIIAIDEAVNLIKNMRKEIIYNIEEKLCQEA